jgi:hypothetical protein
MTKILQPIILNNQTDAVRVSFSIRSGLLEPEVISAELEMDPTWAFSKGESYIGRSLNPQTKEIIRVTRQYPWGVWGLDTRSMTNNRDVNEHLLFLLNILEPKQEKLAKYLSLLDEYSIGFNIHWQTKGDYTGSYEINSPLLSRITSLSHYVDFSFLGLES